MSQFFALFSRECRIVLSERKHLIVLLLSPLLPVFAFGVAALIFAASMGGEQRQELSSNHCTVAVLSSQRNLAIVNAVIAETKCSVRQVDSVIDLIAMVFKQHVTAGIEVEAREHRPRLIVHLPKKSGITSKQENVLTLVRQWNEGSTVVELVVRHNVDVEKVTQIAAIGFLILSFVLIPFQFVSRTISTLVRDDLQGQQIAYLRLQSVSARSYVMSKIAIASLLGLATAVIPVLILAVGSIMFSGALNKIQQLVVSSYSSESLVVFFGTLKLLLSLTPLQWFAIFFAMSVVMFTLISLTMSIYYGTHGSSVGNSLVDFVVFCIQLTLMLCLSAGAFSVPVWVPVFNLLTVLHNTMLGLFPVFGIFFLLAIAAGLLLILDTRVKRLFKHFC